MARLGNIKLVPGTNIPYHECYRRNCQFNYMEFGNVEVVTMKSDPESSETKKNALKKIMKGKQSIIYMHTIGKVGGLTSGNTTIMGSGDAEKYNELPCCIQTSYGTLVPQVIVPTKNVVDNGLSYPNGVNVQISQSKKNGGYTWRATKLDKEDYNGDETALDNCINSQLTYGERVPMFKCVTNEHSGKSMVDKPIFTTRKYKCDTENDGKGSGSCAFCYKIVENNEVGDGLTQEQKEQAPMIKIQLAGKMGTNGVSSQVNTIGAVISKSGQMIGVCGDNIGQGSMSAPSSDIMPPQCTNNGEDYDLYPLFMYPLYNGFIMTNSVLSNLKNGGNTIFIQYDDAIQNPIYTCKVNNVRKSDEMDNLDKVDDTSELMKWFPTLYQECRTPGSIRIKVPRSEKIDFADTISVDFYKCLGRFAYCPIYFHRKIKFTLYFKGEYQSSSDDDGMDKTYGVYRFYPLVCANIGDNTADEWSGINSDGAQCVSNVRHVVDDDDLEESIYAVDFEFESSDFQRYPIEIFGAVAVYERQDFQFKVESDNGGFKFEKDIMDVFTGFAEDQKKFKSCKVTAPEDGSQNNWGGDKKFFSLISNINVSASLDGVSGSMTLDGYPLKQGIKVFRQDQSIGEIDFAVSQKEIDSKGREVEKIHPIFSGYGMALSTNDGDNNYNISVELVGINRKLEDMKLICAPFWDGDRLEMICAYFEEYAKIKIKMIDHTVTSYGGAKSVRTSPYYNGDEHSDNGWSSDSHTICNSTEIAHPSFRVPRSCDWRSPSVNFNTGTSVIDALKQLGTMTGCVCVPQLDGSIVYYELNNYGFPFYVDNQKSNIVEFEATDIISISMQPQLQNKYNSIATFGFLQRKNAQGKILAEENVQHGAFYSKTNDGNMPNVGVQYPWSRHSIGVESAMYTKMELAEVHANRVKMMTADIYLGNMTVRGNTMVDHIYQKIKVCGVEYFVISIEHSVDLSSKVWTTSYQLQCINRTSDD